MDFGSKIENCKLNVKVESRKYFCFILRYSPAIEDETGNIAGGMILN